MVILENIIHIQTHNRSKYQLRLTLLGIQNSHVHIFISGPFWICTTLAFTTAITGNLANYLATKPENTYVWKYEFRKGNHSYLVLSSLEMNVSTCLQIKMLVEYFSKFFGYQPLLHV